MIRAARPTLVAAGLLLAFAGAGIPALAARHAPNATRCTDTVAETLSTQTNLKLNGLYSYPQTPPTSLVVFAHGYRNTSASWAGHLKDAAAHGAVAVAVDYRGLGPAPDFRGWPAKAGGEDLVTAAKFFLAQCKTVKQVILMGVSMGGNMSGLALAAMAVRPDGAPLFDYWIDVEGATNVTETFTEATLVAQDGNAYAAAAAQDIRNETGGIPATVPQAYMDRSVVLHGDEIAASGVKGVAIVHAVADGLVPFNQSAELLATLRLHQVKTDTYAVIRKDTQEGQTTLPGPLFAALGQPDPFAGHGWEGSSTDIVIRTGLGLVWDLLAGKPGPSNRTFVVDQKTVQPIPPLP